MAAAPDERLACYDDLWERTRAVQRHLWQRVDAGELTDEEAERLYSFTTQATLRIENARMLIECPGELAVGEDMGVDELDVFAATAAEIGVGVDDLARYVTELEAMTRGGKPPDPARLDRAYARTTRAILRIVRPPRRVPRAGTRRGGARGRRRAHVQRTRRGPPSEARPRSSSSRGDAE